MNSPILIFLSVVAVLHYSSAAGPNITMRKLSIPKRGTRGDFYTQVQDVTLNFSEAKAACEKNGKRLATVTNAEDNAAIGMEMLRLAKAGKKGNHGFLGGTDAGHEGKWIWVASGDPIKGYTNWDTTGNDKYYNCLQINPNGKWTPVDCGNQIAIAICQDRT